MKEFIVLVGMPGSGKSTTASLYEYKGYKVHSMDAIRNELNIHEINRAQEVLNIAYERIIADLLDGHNVVFDSTNLSRKRRMKLLSLVKEFKHKKICHTLIVPIDECKRRNSKRTGFAKVTDAEYNIMIDHFNIPTSDEGWDKIILDIQDDKIKTK